MEFEEVHVSRLASPTTCYSGGGGAGNNKPQRLASETHTFQVTCSINIDEKQQQDNDDDDDGDASSNARPDLVVLHERVPHPHQGTSSSFDQDVSCVGYSFLEMNGVLYEAFGLMDDTIGLEGEPQTEEGENNDSPTTDGEESSTIRTQDGGGNINNNASTSNLAADHRPLLAAPTTTTTTTTAGNAAVTPNAWLVMKQTMSILQNDDDNDNNNNNNNVSSSTSTAIYSIPLSFRPLSPHVMCLSSCKKEDNNENNSVEPSSELVGIWVGSADDSQIRLYIPNNNEGACSLTLVNVLFDSAGSEEEANGNNSQQHDVVADDDYFDGFDDDKSFSSTPLLFSSPVMTIDSSSLEKQRVLLVVGCQDGTIRLVYFEGCNYDSTESLRLMNVQVHNTIVDGPIVSLCMSTTSRNSTGEEEDATVVVYRVMVGSMCGFVCELTLETRTTNNCTAVAEEKEETPTITTSIQHCWEGPTMVVEKLWNAQLDTEDSVTALSMWKDDDMVAVGTQSGQVVVLKKNKQEHNVVWKCQLPFSIHGLSLCDTITTPSTMPRLFITTEWAVHLFCPVLYRYSADTAKRRVLELLKLHQTETAKT